MAPKAPKELSKQERLDLAIEDYNRAFIAYQIDPQSKKPSVRAIAKSYNIIHTTLARRVAGKTHSYQEAHEDEQRLTPEEEQALASWILQVAEWGWPPRVSFVKYMTCEMLIEKGDYRKLGDSWIYSFLRRHKDLRSRWSQPLDKERNATHDPDKLMRYFELVESVIQKYDVQKADTYNMDEKGSALGDHGKEKIICFKHNLQAYQAQDGTREWVSLIECISADGRLLALFIIFKGKRQMKFWFTVLEDKEACIALSENGWTNNVLGLEWFTRYFPSTLYYADDF